MESDVPLIEITEEDDSLLQLIQDDNVSSSNRSKSTSDDAIFFCSPLQPCRSKPVVVNEKTQKPSSPSCRDSIDKENNGSNANKIEEQKLSLQPQQMKRKKGGGYNLRKSLAWDRAFFTDEGVLNSEELSLISGSTNSNGLLSVIHEDTNSIADSEDLEVIEEKLFKVLPESPSSKDRTVGGSFLPKRDSSAKDNAAPGSAAKRKVLSARDINRSGSKRSGCPRPLASSSLKRPANVNTMKSPIKEPRISTLPVRKPDPCLLSRTSKNVMVGANDLKRNQVAHPGKLNNNKTGPNNAKVAPGKSLTSKSSVRQARRNVASFVKGSPTKIPCPPSIEANNGFEVISKQTLPSTGHASYGHDDRSKKTAVPQMISKQALPSTGHASYGRNDRSRKTAAPEAISKQALPSTGHATYGCDDRSRKPAVPLPHTGVNLSRTQLPTSKPSGLRMPSPSLSFFHQPKASSLPSPLKTSSQPCIIPNLRQVGSVDPIHELRPPSSLGKKQNVINDRTVIGNVNVQCSSSGCSVSSTINSATKDKVEPFSQVTNMQKVELKVQSSSSSYDMTENQPKFNSIPVHEDQQSMGEVEFQRNDDKFLLQGGSCEQLVKDDNSVKAAFDMEKPHVTPRLSSAVKFPCFSGENDITVHQLLEDKSHDLPQKNCGVLLRSKYEEASSSGSVLISYDDQSSSDHNVNELHGAEADLFKPMTSEGSQISDEDQMIWENTGSFTKECQVSEDIQSYSSVKVAGVSPKVQNSSASELKRSDPLSDSRFKNQAKDDGSRFNSKTRNPHVEDAQMLALGGRMIDEMNDVDLSTSAPENCQLVITDCGNEKPEQLDLPNSCYVGEQVFQENKLHLNDCVLDGFSIFPEESQQKNVLQCVDSKEPEGTGACRSESEFSRTLSLIGNINVQCSSSCCSVSSTINSATKDKVEPFSQVTDMQKVELKVQPSSNSYDMTENQQKFNSIPVHEEQQSMGEVEFQRNVDKSLLQGGSCEQLDKDDNRVKDAFVLTPKSKDMDKPHVTPHLSSAVKFPCFSGENKITIHQLLEDKPHDLPQKNCGVLLKSKSEEASSSGGILIAYDDQSSRDHNVNELHGAEAELFKPMTCEGNQISDEDHMIWENTCSFTKECQVSEEIQSYSSVKVADVSPKVQNSSASELKRSDALSDPHVEDAQMLALGGRFMDEMNDADLSTSFPENCGRLIDEMIDVDLSTSAPENCQLARTDCGDEKPERPDLPNSCYVGEQVSQENKLHLNDCELDGFSIFPEESQQKFFLQFVDSKGPEGTGTCRNESEVSRTVSLIPHGMLDFSSNVAEIVESQNVDNTASVSENNETVVESYNLDSQSMSDFQLHCQDCSLKLDSVGDFTSKLNVKVQVEGRSAVKDIIEPKDFGTKDCNLPVESCYGVPQLQTEDDKSYCQQDTSVEQSDKINLSSDIGVIREYQDINPGSCLNGTLLANSASCKVFEETVHEVGLDDSDACGIESKNSKVAAAMHDGRPDLEEKADYLQMEVAVTSSFKIEPSSENLKSCTKSSHDNKLSNQAGPVESDVSAKTTNEENSVSTLAYSSCEGELCSSVISDPRSSSGRILQEIEVNVLSRKTLAEESEINILEENHTLSSELQHELEDTLHPTEDNEATKEIKKSGSDRKQDAPVIKLPSDAVPFSDEWLAALEAAGEEILTKKSGAVQNSPPNKSEPQIGPWSPVKRKTNQVIGPFDCTKHTNNVPPSSQ
ncbi:uncharacterized protein LOC117632442 isoform X2 [Prunus dulcis]|uniref:uncharacterized protein LOC117632442 isoform X2 n=1 Tax=Prunus dulcis TaxID=3755 RepID=UPI0014822036|nr:uncharacterized protein LOC117632442 isoform X2 [Prunus dulcis]